MRQKTTVFGVAPLFNISSSARRELKSAALAQTLNLMFSLSGGRPITAGSFKDSRSVTTSNVSFVAVAVSAKILMLRGIVLLNVPISENAFLKSSPLLSIVTNALRFQHYSPYFNAVCLIYNQSFHVFLVFSGVQHAMKILIFNRLLGLIYSNWIFPLAASCTTC